MGSPNRAGRRGALEQHPPAPQHPHGRQQGGDHVTRRGAVARVRLAAVVVAAP